MIQVGNKNRRNDSNFSSCSVQCQENNNIKKIGFHLVTGMPDKVQVTNDLNTTETILCLCGKVPHQK